MSITERVLCDVVVVVGMIACAKPWRRRFRMAFPTNCISMTFYLQPYEYWQSSPDLELGAVTSSPFLYCKVLYDFYFCYMPYNNLTYRTIHCD